MSLNVLCLTPWFPNAPGDREGNYIYDSVMAVREQRININVLLARPWKPWRKSTPSYRSFPDDLYLRLLHFPSIPRDYFRGVCNRMRFAALYGRVVHYAAKYRINVIHAHTEALAEVAAAAAQRLGISSLVTIHGINTSYLYIGNSKQKAYFRRSLNNCDRVVLVGEPLREFFAKITGREDHFRVVHNGFNLSIASQTRTLFNNPARQLISVSNLHEGKGIDLTLKALAGLKAEDINQWHYTVVGDGYKQKEWASLAKKLGIAKQVTFVGSVPHDKVVDYLLAADIFVLPSWREAFGIAYLEAMACGLLTIGVKGQGAAEFIRNCETGLLCEPKDVGSLELCLRKAMGEADLMQQVAEAGRKVVASEYGWKSHARQLICVYNELVPKTKEIPCGS